MKTNFGILMIGTVWGCLTAFSLPVSLHAFQDQERKPRSREQRDNDDDGREARAEKEQALVQQYRALIREIEQRHAESEKEGDQDERRDADSRQVQEKLNQRLEALHQKANSIRKTGDNPDAMKAIHDQIQKTRQQMESLHEQANRKSPGRSVEPKPADSSNDEWLKAALRRVEHLREAARHLKAAEANDIAEKVVQMADQLTARVESAYRQRDEQVRREKVEREVRAAASRERVERTERQGEPRRPVPPRGAGQPTGPTGEDLRALIAEVRRLRAEVNELRARIDGKNR
jgi:hypothetical protein